MQLLHVRDVVCFTTHEGKCAAETKHGKQYEFRYKLINLSSELNPSHFFQINRGEIVNIHYIEQIEPYSSGRLSLKMKNLDYRLVVSAALRRNSENGWKICDMYSKVVTKLENCRKCTKFKI